MHRTPRVACIHASLPTARKSVVLLIHVLYILYILVPCLPIVGILAMAPFYNADHAPGRARAFAAAGAPGCHEDIVLDHGDIGVILIRVGTLDGCAPTGCNWPCTVNCRDKRTQHARSVRLTATAPCHSAAAPILYAQPKYSYVSACVQCTDLATCQDPLLATKTTTPITTISARGLATDTLQCLALPAPPTRHLSWHSVCHRPVRQTFTSPSALVGPNLTQ